MNRVLTNMHLDAIIKITTKTEEKTNNKSEKGMKNSRSKKNNF